MLGLLALACAALVGACLRGRSAQMAVQNVAFRGLKDRVSQHERPSTARGLAVKTSCFGGFRHCFSLFFMCFYAVCGLINACRTACGSVVRGLWL